jgi:hypothetical protein
MSFIKALLYSMPDKYYCVVPTSDPPAFQCYHDSSTVTDELVDKILKPGLLPGAVDIFLDFICYSGGPLPKEMLPEVKVKSGSLTKTFRCSILFALWFELLYSTA